jgi:hypothetical protein
MTDYLVPPPTEKALPATLGCDLPFTVRRVDGSGTAVNYPAGTTVTVHVGITPPVVISATISEAVAAVVIPASVQDKVVNGTKWQIVLDGVVDVPLAVGRYRRFDG